MEGDERMSESIADKLFLIRYKCDEQSHLVIKEADACIKCVTKDCNYFCPADVYNWEDLKQTTNVAFENCIECGTCRIACPSDNVGWVYPKGGFGITYKFG
jgi:ferredoxin like protein